MCAEERKIPFKPGLWVTRSSGETRLLGSRCLSCGEVFFPQKSHGYCVHCQQRQLEEVELSPLGKLVNFTVVTRSPAGGFYHGQAPYCFGLVDLDDEVRVETHIDGNFEQLTIGMRVKLIIKTLYQDEEGGEVQIFCFQPVEQ